MSAAHAFTPVWATIDAGHMKEFPVIPGIEFLTILQDNDKAGIEASSLCAGRWFDAGVTVCITDQESNDLNDILMAAA